MEGEFALKQEVQTAQFKDNLVKNVSGVEK